MKSAASLALVLAAAGVIGAAATLQALATAAQAYGLIEDAGLAEDGEVEWLAALYDMPAYGEATA